MGDKLTKFKATKIKPEEYRYFRHISARAVEKNLDLTLYYATFKYRNRLGYRYFVFTKEFFEDSIVDKIHFMKNECLEWAQSNYGEGS